MSRFTTARGKSKIETTDVSVKWILYIIWLLRIRRYCKGTHWHSLEHFRVSLGSSCTLETFSKLSGWLSATCTDLWTWVIARTAPAFVVVPDVLSIFSKIGNLFFFRWSVRCPDVLSKFSKIGNLFFFRRSLRCQHHLKWYILLSVTGNFGLGKWAKIERNDGKLLRFKTSPVDWRIYAWEQWVLKLLGMTTVLCKSNANDYRR